MVGVAGKLLSCGVDAGRVADVERQDDNLTARSLYLGNSPRGAGGVAGADENVEALQRKLATDLPTDSTVAPGDQGGLLRPRVHDLLLRVRRGRSQQAKKIGRAYRFSGTY